MIFIAVAIVAVIVIAVIGWLYSRQRRSKRLRQRFGPEYDRVVPQEGAQRKAEDVLEFRAKRRESLHIHPLDPTQRSTFAKRWTSIQAKFVDDPSASITEADLLIDEVMAARGYPMSDFDQRAAYISVDYPRVVENYRLAHSIARHKHGEVSTEDLRKAMVRSRTLFEDLLEYSAATSKEKRA
jgi:hypothetical protein